MNNKHTKTIKKEVVLHSLKGDIMELKNQHTSKSKIIKIDNKEIKVDLLNNIKPKDIPKRFTGSHINVKCLIDKVLD